MGLSSSLQIGRSALSAAQVAIQVTGNNFANASTPGYSRQVVDLSAVSDQQQGSYFVGRGVQVDGIQRQVDEALLTRQRDSLSNESAASSNQQILSTLESTVGALSDNDLSTQLQTFYDSWSTLANSPAASGSAAQVIQQGGTLADSIKQLRSNLVDLKSQNEGQIDTNGDQADQLLTQIAGLNVQIANAGAGGNGASALQDQRDQALSSLSKLMDITVVPQPSGVVNVLVGSTPIVLAGVSRGIEVETTGNGETTQVTLNVRADNTQLNVTGGTLGSLLSQRTGPIDDTIKSLDNVSSQLIFQVNKIVSTGYSQTPVTSLQSTQQVSAGDTTKALNDPSNATLANLPYQAQNGGFNVTIKNAATGATQTVRVNVDLDGIQNNGQPGYADDTSVSSLTSALNGVTNLSATLQPNGTIKINAATGYSVSFSEDSSNVLATLGINSYFTGTDATNIGVRSDLQATPGLLSTGQTVGDQSTDNGAALAVANLQTTPIAALGNQSIDGAWKSTAATIGSKSAAASSAADATKTVRQNLDAQVASVSGVDLDEESINLLTYQRMYQGAAKFISTVNDLTQTLLDIIK